MHYAVSGCPIAAQNRKSDGEKVRDEDTVHVHVCEEERAGHAHRFPNMGSINKIDLS